MSISRCAAQVVLALLLSWTAFAQRPGPTSPEHDKRTIKTKVRVVLLDVVVTDSKSRPISGLRQQDFSVFEDGKLQHILSFETHSVPQQSPSPPQLSPVDRANLGPNVFLNTASPEDSFPLNIILLDLLNTPIDSQPFAHKQILNFLKHKPPGGRYAIFVLADKLRLLQGFTEDADALIAAMNRKEAQTQIPGLYQSAQEAYEGSNQLSSLGGGPANTKAMVDRLQQMEVEMRVSLLTRRVERTTAAFSEIARFVSGLPGRKNLIWLSGAFPATILAGSDPLDPFGSTDFSPEVRQASDLMKLNQIAIYPVDSRGLETNPAFSAADNTNYSSSQAFVDASVRFELDLFAEHDLMDQIAEESGGHAFYNTNGLERAIATGIQDGTNYYTLSYSPTNLNFDGQLRKIRITLDHRGYSLAYRRSYLADDDSRLAEKKAHASSDHLSTALRRGTPEVHELAFILRVHPDGKPVVITPTQIHEFSRSSLFADLKDKESMQVQRYLIDYTVPARQLTFLRSADGVRRAFLEFYCVAYDAEGKMITGRRSSDQEVLPAQSPVEARNGYVRANQLFDIPVAASWLRVAIRDASANRIGAIEISLPVSPEPASP